MNTIARYNSYKTLLYTDEEIFDTIQNRLADPSAHWNNPTWFNVRLYGDNSHIMHVEIATFLDQSFAFTYFLEIILLPLLLEIKVEDNFLNKYYTLKLPLDNKSQT